MKLHIVNYQLRILLLSLRNPVGNSDSPELIGNEVTARKVPTRRPDN